MEPRQGPGSRQFQYANPSSQRYSPQQTNPAPAASSKDSQNTKTHRRQTSEPASFRQLQHSTSSGSHKVSSFSRTDSSSNPTSESRTSSKSASQHRQSERPASTLSTSLSTPLSGQSLDVGSHSKSRSSEAKSRQKGNGYSASEKAGPTNSTSSGRLSKTTDSKSCSTKEDDRKSEGSSATRSHKTKDASSVTSKQSSQSKQSHDIESKHTKGRESKTSSGKTSNTPKTKRRPRSSSQPRHTTTDEGDRRAQKAHLLEEEVDTSHYSSLSQDSSVSSRLLPEQSSSSSNTHDKITSKERDRKPGHSNTKDFDTRSTKSERLRSKRAMSAPREIRPVNGRDKYDTEDRRSHGKGSISYHQLPKYDSSKHPTTSMQQKSSKKHRSLMDMTEELDINEGGISMKELSPAQFERHKNDRHHYNKSPNTEPSTYSRTDHETSSKSPRNASRKYGYGSDAELKSDSEKSNRGPSVSSAEEPLLPKGHMSNKKTLSTRPDGSGTGLAPNIQTFPRMKNLRDSPKKISTTYPVGTATIDRHQTGKTQFLLDRIRNFSSNQIPSNEPYFSPLHKIPSQSSSSSDARSEVCLDLPDMPEDNEDLYPDRSDLKVNLTFPVVHYDPIVHITHRSICKSVLIKTVRSLISFILVWPLIVVLIVLVPLVFLIKKFCSWCCCCGKYLWGRCCICLCHTHLTSSELVWLGRGYKSNPVVQSLVVIQRGLDTDRIRHLIDSRILFVENRHGRKLYPRFTQRIVEFCCGQAWVTDRSFVTANHIFNMPGYIETLDDLQQFISKMASEPLSLRHPLWEVQVLHNFREPRDTVLLFRMHMSMTDGISMVHVLQNALVDSQKSSTVKASFSDEAANTSLFKVLLSGPLTFMSRYVCRRDDFNLIHGGHFQTSGESVVAWSEPFSLSAALRVKQVARCTLADLLLSITAGTIRTYLQVCGIRHPSDVTCAVPVDFQSLDGGALDMENKYAVVHIPLPTNTEGSIPRLWEVKHAMEHFKASAEAAVVNGTRWLTHSLLPISCFQRLWQKLHSRCTLLVSNLAGPTSVLKLDSKEIKCMMYWVPPLEKVAVTVSFFTYADQIRMAVISDRSALPNPELLTRDFIYKLETLSKLLAHRRIPGESSYSPRHENVHLLSNFTLDDLTADQIQLEISLVQQELHDLKIQLDSGPSNHISHNDTKVIERIEALKERSSELMMHLRKRKAEEAECAVILSDEVEDLNLDLDGQPKPFRRRTLSMSSRMSTTSISSTNRPLSTASTSNLASNLPSPTHHSLPSWPEDEIGMEDLNEEANVRRPQALHRFPHRPDPELDSPEHQDYRISNPQHAYSNPYSSHKS